MRWFAFAALLLLAGCIRPLSAGQDPDRESVSVPRGEFFGEALAVNGTMRVSVVPAPVAAPVGEEPVNCFILQDAAEERQSYLGGLSVDLVWTASSGMTERLNVTVSAGTQLGGFYELSSAEGRSPMHFVYVDPLEDDSQPFRTPLRVVVKPVGLALPVPDQPIEWAATVGILESAIRAIGWRDCEAREVVEPPVEPPVASSVRVA